MTTTTTARRAATRMAAPQSKEDVQSALLDFFIDEIKDIYWAEKHLVKALPKMQKAATSEELQEAIGNHLEQTKGHVIRLEEVFSMLDEKPQAKKCDAMDGIVEEGKEILDDTESGTATRDVGIILAGQKVEHYEIATYGGLAQLAKTIGRNDIAEILGQTLSEEKETDEKLSRIAEEHVNYEASKEEED